MNEAIPSTIEKTEKITNIQTNEKFLLQHLLMKLLKKLKSTSKITEKIKYRNAQNKTPFTKLKIIFIKILFIDLW